MFVIFKNKRPAGNQKYITYEQARQAVRKRLRKLVDVRNAGQPSFPMWALGYEIRRV
jgi:hypothetical protein